MRQAWYAFVFVVFTLSVLACATLKNAVKDSATCALAVTPADAAVFVQCRQEGGDFMSCAVTAHISGYPAWFDCLAARHAARKCAADCPLEAKVP